MDTLRKKESERKFWFNKCNEKLKAQQHIFFYLKEKQSVQVIWLKLGLLNPSNYSAALLYMITSVGTFVFDVKPPICTVKSLFSA